VYVVTIVITINYAQLHETKPNPNPNPAPLTFLCQQVPHNWVTVN